MPTIIQNIDVSILLFIQNHLRVDFLTPIMKFFSLIDEGGAIFILIAIILFLKKSNRKLSFTLLASLLVAFLVNALVLQKLIARPRPPVTVPELEALVDIPKSFSMPSGHTVSSFVCAYVLSRGLRRGGWAFYVLASLISLSRLYLGVHYPTDIISGVIFGILCGAIMYPIFTSLYDRAYKRKNNRR